MGGVIKKPRRRSLILLNLLLALIPLTYFGHPYALTLMAHVIVAEGEPRKADVIVPLAGLEFNRARGAADLYNAGIAPLVVITSEMPPGGTAFFEAMLKRGVRLAESWENYRRVLEGFGVPREKIVRIEPYVSDTFMELSRLREKALEKGWTSVVIVTSRYHTRRTKLVAGYVLGNDIAWAVVPTPYDPFTTDTWWKSRTQIRTFILELQKLVAYAAYIWPRELLGWKYGA